jgi:hypothetical protein
MLHDPTTLFSLLPLIYGFGYVDVDIFYITHVESMERDLHAVIIADRLLFAYKFGSNGKYLGDYLGAGQRHGLVFQLCAIGTPEIDEMHPTAQGTVHVEPALRVSFGQNTTSLLFGYAIKDSPSVGFSSGSNDTLLFFTP